MTTTKKSVSLEDYLLCLICCDPLKEPKILQCGHTFCRTCLQRLLMTKSEDEEAQLSCPNCNQLTSVPGDSVDNLPNNILVRQMGDCHQHRKSKELKCSECSSHSVRPVRFVCHDCRTYYCEVCYKKHEMYLEHNVEDLQTNTFGMRQALCDQHEKVILDYCTDCSTGLCAGCLADHQAHKIVGIADKDTIKQKIHEIKKSRSVLSETLQQTEQKSELLQSIYTELNNIYASHDSELLKFFTDLKKQVNKKLDSMYEELENERYRRRAATEKELDIFQEALNFHTSSCQNLDSLIDEVVGEKTKFVSPLCLYSGILARLDTLSKSLPGPEFIHTITVADFEENEAFLDSWQAPGWWAEKTMAVHFAAGQICLTPCQPTDVEFNLDTPSMQELGLSTSTVFSSAEELDRGFETINRRPSNSSLQSSTISEVQLLHGSAEVLHVESLSNYYGLRLRERSKSDAAMASAEIMNNLRKKANRGSKLGRFKKWVSGQVKKLDVPERHSEFFLEEPELLKTPSC